MNNKQRLEYLRGELRAERISQAELAELQSLAAEIEPGDVELLEAAGVPEKPFNDELKPQLDALLKDYAERAGTDLSGAIRDVLTQMIDICAEARLNIYERLRAAKEVYEEPSELDRKMMGDELAERMAAVAPPVPFRGNGPGGRFMGNEQGGADDLDR